MTNENLRSLAPYIETTRAIRPVIMTVRETAMFLNCCEETVRRMIRTNAIPAFLCGKTYRIDRGELLLAMRGNAEKKTLGL